MHLLTQGGRHFDFDCPQPNMVSVEDVAHALSGLNRFRGHGRYPFSVALHSVAVADYLAGCGESAEIQLAGLLHDAHKAFLGDVPEPIVVTPYYHALKARTQAAVALALGVTLDELHAPAVRQANLVARAMEADALLPPDPMRQDGSESVSEAMKAQMMRPVWLPSSTVAELFLQRYADLRHAADWSRAAARLPH